MSYTRFALYAVPDGDLGDFGARWLGWDVRTGTTVDPFPIAGLDDVTMTPRKYGFHGTIKPPFRLAEGSSPADLEKAAATLATATPAAATGGVQLTVMGGFLALTPVGNAAALNRVAASFLRELDGFRAPPPEDELARRRAAGLTATQEANLTRWGYPYVLDEFQFHLTLTGRLPPAAQGLWTRLAAARLPPAPIPFALDTIGLAGERSDGRFELIHRYTLTG